MKAKYIISLREDIFLGKGFSKRLDVVNYYPDLEMQSFICFKTVDGKEILVNKNNVKSILTVEDNNA